MWEAAGSELNPANAASFPHRFGDVVRRFRDDGHGCGGLRANPGDRAPLWFGLG